jgi:hypothetical protein
MGNKTKLISYKTGILIFTKDSEIISQLRANTLSWQELSHPTSLHLFASSDIAPEIKKLGLPMSVRRRLAAQAHTE